MNNKESLKTIILWWLGTFIILLLIIFNTIFYEMLKHSFYNRVSNSLSIIANQTKDKLIPTNDKIITLPEKLDYPINPVMINVIAANDMKVVAKTATFMDIPLERYLNSDNNFFIIRTKKYSKVGIYILRIISPIKGYIIVATPMYKIDIKLQDILVKMLILNPILLFGLLLLANFVIDRILNPIKDITKVANEISVGDLNRTIPLPLQRDEIYDLVESFNKMVIRLRNGIEMMERFNSDVSHELKTPITVIKGEIEIALRKDRSNEYYKNTLNILLKEVNYLIELVEEMLFFSKIENEIGKNKLEQIDDILLNVVSKLQPKAKEKNIVLNIDRIEKIDFEVNSILLKTIFVNLIDNSIKYSFENSEVKISLYKEDGAMVFEVEDNGIGIKDEDISKIMDRFYRTEKSRNRNIKGFGLGLSIVQKSLEILNGKIDIQSSENKGTKIKVSINVTKI